MLNLYNSSLYHVSSLRYWDIWGKRFMSRTFIPLLGTFKEILMVVYCWIYHFEHFYLNTKKRTSYINAWANNCKMNIVASITLKKYFAGTNYEWKRLEPRGTWFKGSALFFCLDIKWKVKGVKHVFQNSFPFLRYLVKNV